MGVQWQDRTNRIETAIAATIVDPAGGERSVEIVGLSSSGFRLRSAERLDAGQDVTLRVAAHGDFGGRIQWVAGRDAGGRFNEPVLLM